MQLSSSCSIVLVVAVFSLLVDSGAAQDVLCPQGCTSDFEPTAAADGLVYMNSCVARCQGAVIVKSQKGQKSAGARPVTSADMLAHAAEGYKFIDFALVRRIKPTLRGSNSFVSPPSLQGLPLDRVIRFDVARGAIYSTAQPASLPAATAAVSNAAVQGAPGTAPYKATEPATTANVSDAQPEIWNPEVVVDLPVKKDPQQPEPAAAADKDAPAAGQPAAADAADQLEPQLTNDVGRKLRKLNMVLSPDERKEVTVAPNGLPLAAVGQLLAHGQEWHCSAALIGERTIITAAHCVYDRTSGAFGRGLYFVPGRFRDASGAIQAPFGAYDVSEVFIMSQFVAGEPQDIWNCDMAVVRLNEAVQVGKLTGYLGVQVPAADVQQQQQTTPAAASEGTVALAVLPSEEASRIQPTAAAGSSKQQQQKKKNGRKLRPGKQPTPANTNQLGGPGDSNSAAAAPNAAANWKGDLTTAGYPADRAEGTLVTTSCHSEQQVSAAPGATIKLACSTQVGQSGSPLVTPEGQVRGVVTFEVQGADGYNGGTAITHYLWANLLQPNVV